MTVYSRTHRIWRRLAGYQIVSSHSPPTPLTTCRSFFTLSALGKADNTTTVAVKAWNRENLNCFGPILKPNSAVPKNGRGRPRKVSDPIVSDSAVDGNSKTDPVTAEDAPVVKKRRGRPKKNADQPITQVTASVPDTSEVGPSNEPTLKVKGQLFTEGDAMASRGPILYQNEKKSAPPATQEPDLDGILFFPFIPTDRTEYYITPPEVPEINIPGYTERAAFDDPFFPSVGTILSATQPIESRAALKRWKDKLVREIGEDGFRKFKKEILERGSNFHRCLQEYLSGETMTELSTANQGYWHSAKNALSDLEDVLAIEEKVLHRNLCYKGIFDCVGKFRNETVLIDWKTSKKAKAELKYTYDNPLQVAAYTGAYNFTQGRNIVIDKAVIVVCYEDGQPAHTHTLSRSMCVAYWSKWLERLHAYWTNKLNVTHSPSNDMN